MVPFLSEELYTNLVAKRNPTEPQSVHLSDWPTADTNLIDEALSMRTNLAMRLASLGRAARATSGIRVRQPLETMVVQLNSAEERTALPLIATQLKDELNIKNVIDASETQSLMAYRLRPNLPVLGPKYGRQVNEIRGLLETADAADVADSVLAGNAIEIGQFTLQPEEVLVDSVAAEGYAVEADSQCTVGISTSISEELRAEGNIRDIAHIIQNMRKSAGLEISDRILLWIEAPSDTTLSSAIKQNQTYIAQETLAKKINDSEPPQNETDKLTSETHHIDGTPLHIKLKKA